MKLLSRLKRLLKGNQKNVFPQAKHRIVEAFICDGEQYYQFDDPFNLPYERGLHALSVYEELRMRCTREYLSKYTAAIDKLIKTKTINVEVLSEMLKLNNQLKERLDFVFEPETAYKLASVVYFDRTENPYKYEGAYASKKIERWKAAGGAYDFFTQKPLVELIPFLRDADSNFQTYLEIQKQILKIHSGSISSVLLRNSTRSSTAN